jgi:hypothetical protein
MPLHVSSRTAQATLSRIGTGCSGTRAPMAGDIRSIGERGDLAGVGQPLKPLLQ